MKTFETPVVDVKKFDVEDVLTASGAAAPEEEAGPTTTARPTVTDQNGNVYVLAPPCL